ncbi:armadillo-type protein [Hypoxylon trugodes]|uniref:armadillo-type protein n=1 Tax=Hypoxylon trugodes TaxID=326681 RepID=UPI0021A12E60|nr:armadillo-type protein [Hypoxylon trugodes]KAI1390723.1 armadillo-type protein [Hypoxylon trugodes]
MKRGNGFMKILPSFAQTRCKSIRSLRIIFLCLAWRDIPKTPIPETVTAIYEAVVFYLWKKDNFRFRGDKSETYMKYAFPEEVAMESEPERKILEYFAFSGMYSNLIDFQPRHQGALLDKLVRCIQGGLSFFERLGCLSFLRTSYPSADKSEQSYHFLHLTSQEFFATEYFVRQWKSQSQLVFLDLNAKAPKTCRMKSEDFLKEYKYNPRYDIVWRFTAGLLTPEEVPEFFRQLEDGQPDLLGPTHQRLVMHCLSEATDIQSRPILERKLSQWLLFECDLMGHSLLARESEFPYQPLHGALNDRDESRRVKIIETLRSRDWLGAIATDLAVLFGDVNEEVQYAAVAALEGKYDLVEGAITKLLELVLDNNALENTRYAAAETLGLQRKSPETTAKLIRLFQDANAFNRECATEALGYSPDLSEENFSTLVTLLQDKDISVQESAARILGRSSDIQETITTIVTLLRDTNPGLLVDVLWRQENLPENAIVVCGTLLKSSYKGTRKATLKILEKQPNIPQEVTAALMVVIRDDDNYHKFLASRVLQKQPNLSEQVIIALVRLLENADWNVQLFSAAILRYRSEFSKKSNILEPLLHNADATTQYSIAKAIALQSKLPFPDVVQLPGSCDGWTLPIWIKILKEQLDLPEDKINKLVQLLKDANQDIQKAVAEALERRLELSEQSITSFIGLVKDKTVEDCIRLTAAEILGSQPDLSAMDFADDPYIFRGFIEHGNLSQETTMTLKTLIEHESEDVRVYAAAAALNSCAKLREEATTILIMLLESQDWETKYCATTALKALSDLSENATEILIQLLEEPNADTRNRVLQIFGEQSDLSENAIEALVRLLGEPDRDIRNEVMQVLGRQPSFLKKIADAFITLLGYEDLDV